VRKKNKFRVRIDEFLDEPRASNSIDFNFFPSNPFHKVQLLLRQNL
jgi:hypothetical protein